MWLLLPMGWLWGASSILPCSLLQSLPFLQVPALNSQLVFLNGLGTLDKLSKLFPPQVLFGCSVLSKQ